MKIGFKKQQEKIARQPRVAGCEQRRGGSGCSGVTRRRQPGPAENPRVPMTSLLMRPFEAFLRMKNVSFEEKYFFFTKK